jgi:hypothetical protein
MRNRAARGLLAVSSLLVLLTAGLTASPAQADTIHRGNYTCSMYANSTGFGAYCSSGTRYVGGVEPTWAQRLRAYQQATNTFGPFIPCRDWPVPDGVQLPPPPEGKTWSLRIWIVDYDMSKRGGGERVHLEREIVPVSEEERDQCRRMPYMDMFWNEWHSTYPSPVLVIKPTYTPRVNVPAYFSLTRDSAWVITTEAIRFDGHDEIRMRAIVGRMTVDPGDGSRPFDCLMGVENVGDDGYDETKDPFHQTSTCKHVYKRSSAGQPHGMYTVKLTVYWDVAYWTEPSGWRLINTVPVNAVQRLPVQEVQAIGG